MLGQTECIVRALVEKEIVLATHNAGKVVEINDLLEPFGVHALSAAALGLAEPIEDGTTFEENALIKAHAAARASGKPALSDDSGLCVDALDGAPGIHTADWAELPEGGRDFDFAMERLQRELHAAGAIARQDRTARFVAVLCLYWPDGHHEDFRGEIEGEIVWPPRGKRGFGYDPVFLPAGHTRTFGEMDALKKHGWKPGHDTPPLSHRARAFEKFANQCLGKVT